MYYSRNDYEKYFLFKDLSITNGTVNRIIDRNLSPIYF